LFEENEILTFILGLISIAIIIPFSQKLQLRGIKQFYIGIVFLVLSYLFTNVEGICCNEIFNLLEHSCVTISAIFFFIAVKKIKRGIDFK